MRIHDLKTWPEYFERMKSGQKTFEVRKNDRDFQVGDKVVLQEYDPSKQEFTNSGALYFKITYILHGSQFGIDEGFCVMQLESDE